jgi:Zn-dependent protease with chaperone function
MQRGGRSIETSALAAFAPIITLFPLCLAALAVVWLPLRLVSDLSYTWFAVGYLLCAATLFVKPIQVLILSRALGARQPTRDERIRLDTAWRSVLQAARLPSNRYVIAVLPADELNAYACGGHLVIVTTLAIETLPRDELTGVLAHELSHHLGLHTVALTITQWIGLPVMLLARFGFYLQNVASAATTSFASHSAALTAVGRLTSALLTAVSWVFLSGLIAANTIGNVAGRGAEYQADQRAVNLGFGGELANALRRLIALGGGERPRSWRERLAATHPAARTRIAKIDAARRARPT